MKEYDVIIIGGGVAGLACANKLKGKKDFLLITEDIGGRIAESEDGKYNYGAYFIGEDYKNFRKFARKKQRIRLSEIEVHKKKLRWHLLDLFKHPVEVARLLLEIWRFDAYYRNFREDSLVKPQDELIRRNEYFNRLYRMTAKELIKELRIEKIFEKYLNPLMKACTFSEPSKYSAFEMLHYARYIQIPIYRFSFLKNKMTKGLGNLIVFDKIKKIKYGKDCYLVEGKEKYKATTVVVATSPAISQKLLNLRKIKKPASCYMFHLKGTISDKWKHCDFDLFQADNNIYALAKQSDGSYLLCSKKSRVNFKKCFKNYEMIKKIYWEKAFHMNGNVLWKMEQKKNLYLIGDHNVCGLEEAFITGICAANKILSKKV